MNNNTRFYNSENGRRVDEGFEFSGMSDVDYTDTFADIDQKEETESAVKIAAGKDLVFELGDEIGLIFTTFDDNGDPLGFDGSGNLIVRLDIDMKLARPGQSAPPPSELAFRIDLSRGGFTEFTKKFGSWSLVRGRLLNSGKRTNPDWFERAESYSGPMLRLFPTASGDLRGAPAAVTNLSVSVDSATRTLTGGPRRLDGESDLRIAIDSLRSLEGAPDYVGGSMEIYFDNINEKKYKGPDFLAGTPLRIGEDFNATFVFAPFEPGERILPAGRELRAGGAVNFITSDDAYVGGKGKKRDVMTFDYNGWTDSLSIVDDNKKYGYRYDEELSPAEKKIYDTAVDGIDAWSIAICIAKPAGIQKMMSDGVDTIPGDSVDHGEYRTKQ